MKNAFILALSTLLLASCLFGQARTDAEERFKMKTGRLYPATERMLEEKKKAAEKNRTAIAHERRKAGEKTATKDAVGCSCNCQPAGQ